jgi:hypothetical protein
MVNENKIIFYSEELNEDIIQNNDLLNSKEILTQHKMKEQKYNKNNNDGIIAFYIF